MGWVDDRGIAATLRLLAPVVLVVAAPVATQAILPPFDASYSSTDLGPVPGVPPNYGGLTIFTDTPGTLIIGGRANTSAGALYSIGLVRDLDGHISGFTGTATRFAEAAFNDGGVTAGPSDVLFLARWPVNSLGQLQRGSSVTDRINDMRPFGVGGSSLSALTFVPAGFPGAGALKLVSWPAGNWYTAEFAPDGAGTFGISTVIQNTVIGGGPEGLAYVPSGSPHFQDFVSLLVTEFSTGSIAAYEVDSDGDPIPATRVPFITASPGAQGALIDPLSGDFLFSTSNGGGRVIAVQGFTPPSCPGTATNYGTGVGGAGELEPQITLNGCPSPGVTITVEISNGRGGAPGCLMMGSERDDSPLGAGMILVIPSDVVSHELQGEPGAAGAGTKNFPFRVPSMPSLIGAQVFFQAGYLDDLAPLGISLTNGLEVVIG
jgi:hypothetical protein